MPEDAQGAIGPAEFFEDKSLNSKLGLQDVDDLWSLVSDKNRLGQVFCLSDSRGPIRYRGQSNSTYGLTSSLYRLCRDERPGGVEELSLANAESAIINEIRTEGVGRRMSDGELLMVLQHHGIPTRLIDVSSGPLEALFFAVDGQDASDGRLFVIRLHDDDSLTLRAERDVFSNKLPWESSVWGTQRARQEWTSSLRLVSDEPLDPRMRAQQGNFLVGGTNRRYRGRSMKVHGQQVRAEDYPDISSIGVNFIKSTRGRPNQAWPATGWTINIPAGWKYELRKRLSNLTDPIINDTMYPPLGEIRRLALRVARQSLG